MYAIEIESVSKKFRKYTNKEISTIKDLFVKGIFRKDTFDTETFWALRDVSFNIAQGKMVGIIGSNGSGKSTLLRLLAGIMSPTSGSINAKGRIAALIELGAGFHPELSGRENVFINGIILGLSKKEIRDRFDEIVRFAGLEDFIDSPVKTYSSGMYMRLGFAIAINMDPDILLIDEILAVGDEEFQHKCLNKINEFKRRGKTLIFVSHDLGTVKKLCDRIVWLKGGKVQAEGDPQEVMDRYLEYIAEKEAEGLLEQNQQSWLTQEDGGQRWGSKAVEFIRVRITDSGGEERYVFETGEDMRIDMDYKVHKAVQEPVFGIGLFTDDGHCVYGTNTQIEDITLGGIGKSGTMTCRLDSVNLTAGTYYLDVAVVSKDGPPYDYRSRLYKFAIRSNVKDLGIYRPVHKWELKPFA